MNYASLPRLHRACRRHHRRLFSIGAIIFALAAGLSPLPSYAQTPGPQPAPSPVFQLLKPGKKVSLSDRGALVDIQVLADGNVGSHVVVEIGPSHVVLDDSIGVTRLWIPVTAFRMVTWTRLPAAGADRQPRRE